MIALRIEELTTVLKKALPVDMHGNINLLIALLRYGQSAPSATDAGYNAEGAEVLVESMLKSLQGREIRTTDTILSFGSNGNFGDVSVRDVVGGNVFTINVYPERVEETEKHGARIRKFEEIVTIFDFLNAELFTIGTKMNMFNAEFDSIIASHVPRSGTLPMKRIQGAIDSSTDDIRAFYLSLRTVRQEGLEWLLSTERSFQFIFLLAQSNVTIPKRHLQELLEKISEGRERLSDLKQAMHKAINALQQMQIALAPTPMFSNYSMAIHECAQELYQLMALIGRIGDFFTRLQSTITVTLRMG